MFLYLPHSDCMHVNIKQKKKKNQGVIDKDEHVLAVTVCQHFSEVVRRASRWCVAQARIYSKRIMCLEAPFHLVHIAIPLLKSSGFYFALLLNFLDVKELI